MADGLADRGAGLRGRLITPGRSYEVATDLAGDFNRLNLAGAVALAEALGVDPGALARALGQPIAVPGRLMRVPSAAPFRVIVDFAHTGEALANLLVGLRRDTPGRLLVVFGAGGDRDRGRRHALAAAAARHADVAIITTDNPRSEDPLAIIEAIVAHWDAAASESRPAGSGRRREVEADRWRAIARALALAREGDTVVLAGKGHETTQLFADRVEPHDDFAIAAAWLAEHYPGPAADLAVGPQEPRTPANER